MLPDIPMLTQSLLTEEGFVNPACVNELEATLAQMPPTYERLAGDKEWTKSAWTFRREITGYFAHWAIRQINSVDETAFPPGLEKMVGYLHACLWNKFDDNDMALLTLCDINRTLHEILMPETIFHRWNDCSVLKGWLDLDALLHNVCISIRNERRAFDDFNLKFEAENLDYDLGAGI